MMACAECGGEHYPGALFCEACGAAVHPAAQARVTAQKTKQKNPQPGNPKPALPAGLDSNPAAIGPQTGSLKIVIPDHQKDLTIRATVIHIGRADPETDYNPELDLTPFDGLEKGVSRRHATIQWAGSGVVLIDNHSSNGTWLNGVRLTAGRPYLVPSQATVRFGDLLVQLTTAD